MCNLQTIRYYWSYIILTIVWDNHLFHNSKYFKYFIYNAIILHVISIRRIRILLDQLMAIILKIFWNILIQMCIDGCSAISFKSIAFVIPRTKLLNERRYLICLILYFAYSAVLFLAED